MFSMPEQPAGGVAVRRARQHAGLTLRQLAADLGVSVGTMSAIENGKVGLTVDRLQQIARRLGMSASQLLDPDTAPLPGPPPPEASPPPAGWRDFAALDLDPVLTSAVEVFNETGYHGATMRVIATGADISIAGMYHHYPSKQRLLVALVELALQDLRWRITAAAGDAAGTVQEFANMVEAMALFHTERAELAHIVLSEMRSLEEPDRSRLTGLQGEIREALDSTASRAVEQGRFAVRDLPTTIRAITTMCLALPYWFPGDGSPGAPGPAGLARRYADLALDMMRVVPDQAGPEFS